MGSAQGKVSGEPAPANTRRRDHDTNMSAPFMRGGGSRRVENGPQRRNKIAGGFDFNSNQPLPWRQEQRESKIKLEPEEPSQPTWLQPRSFANAEDVALLAYLSMRNISPSFLNEIDQFLESHPEISSFPNGRAMIATINSLAPLDAYRYFLKGYTRPARYIDGFIPRDYRLPDGFRPVPLRARPDHELDDFFEGFEFRWDIIDRIDHEVTRACIYLDRGRYVWPGLQRLVAYHVWGNPVDVYKYFEYNYQEEHLAHTYLPEHVVLTEVPKIANYSKPYPSGIGCSRRHMYVRHRMVRAHDEGVDVLDVLISEYKSALVRRGYRRREINDMCMRAQDRLDDERVSPTGADIVDMLMDSLPGLATNRSSRPIDRRRTGRGQHNMRYRASHLRSQVPAFLAEQAVDLSNAKRTMDHLYRREQDAFAFPQEYTVQELNDISYRRGSAERRYVGEVVRYLRASNRMTKLEASDLQRLFTRQRMVGIGPVYKDYLLGLYPRELY